MGYGSKNALMVGENCNSKKSVMDLTYMILKYLSYKLLTYREKFSQNQLILKILLGFLHDVKIYLPDNGVF